MAIHKTAIIDETASIAPDVEIGAYAIIGKDTVIESGCKIGESANIQYAHNILMLCDDRLLMI